MNKRTATLEVLIGIGSLLICHLVLGAISLAIGILGSFVPFMYPVLGLLLWAGIAIGLSQMVYVFPLIHRFKQQRRFNAVKGVVIGAVVTALLNGGCFVYFFWTL